MAGPTNGLHRLRVPCGRGILASWLGLHMAYTHKQHYGTRGAKNNTVFGLLFCGVQGICKFSAICFTFQNLFFSNYLDGWTSQKFFGIVYEVIKDDFRRNLVLLNKHTILFFMEKIFIIRRRLPIFYSIFIVRSSRGSGWSQSTPRPDLAWEQWEARREGVLSFPLAAIRGFPQGSELRFSTLEMLQNPPIVEICWFSRIWADQLYNLQPTIRFHKISTAATLERISSVRRSSDPCFHRLDGDRMQVGPMFIF